MFVCFRIQKRQHFALQGTFAEEHLAELQALVGEDLDSFTEERLRDGYLGTRIPPLPRDFLHPEGVSWACACLETRCAADIFSKCLLVHVWLHVPPGGHWFRCTPACHARHCRRSRQHTAAASVPTEPITRVLQYFGISATPKLSLLPQASGCWDHLGVTEDTCCHS